MIYNLLQSIRLIADACESFTDNCVDGLEANTVNIDKHLTYLTVNESSLGLRQGRGLQP